MQDDAAKGFLLALYEAEQAGLSTDINRIGFVDVETALSVFNRCRKNHWVMGKPDAAWITPAGKQLIGKP